MARNSIMAITTEGQIAELLLAHLEDIEFSPGMPIAYPGIEFEPESGQAYLEAVFLPNATVTRTVNTGGSNQYQGMLQVSVMHPVGKGALAAMDIAGRVISHFARGTAIYGETIAVRVIRQPFSAPPMTEPDWLRIPITIPYLCFAAAN
jgi:hypothetical protein